MTRMITDMLVEDSYRILFLTHVIPNILCTLLLPKFHPNYLQHSSDKHIFTSRFENSVDADQMAILEVS